MNGATTAEIAATIERASAAKSVAARTRLSQQVDRSLRSFLEELRTVVVLDPTCGSGNVLYLALHPLKDIEHPVQLEAETIRLQRGFRHVVNRGDVGVKFVLLSIITFGLYPAFRLLKALVGLFARSSPTVAPKTVHSNGRACPYCGVIQDSPPRRKRKCQACGQPIYVKKFADGRRHLLTETEVAENACRQREDHWKDLSNQVRKAMQEGDWQSLSQAYHGQARILFAEGRNHHKVLRESHKCQLLGMKEIGIKKVEIQTADDERVCRTCRKLHGKVYSISTALKRMPIPCQTCEDRRDVNSHGGYCRCVYLAVFK